MAIVGVILLLLFVVAHPSLLSDVTTFFKDLLGSAKTS